MLTLLSSLQVQLTPLDSALMAEREELVSMLMDHGAVTIARIHNVAATRIQVHSNQELNQIDIQACYRGYRIREMFQERNRLLVKHEQLRAKKRERKKKQRRSKERRNNGGKTGQPGEIRKQSEEKEEGHDGRRRHRDKDRGGHTIRKDSASPRTRIHKVKDPMHLSQLEPFDFSMQAISWGAWLRSIRGRLTSEELPQVRMDQILEMKIMTRTFPGEDEPLPSQYKKLSRSRLIVTRKGFI